MRIFILSDLLDTMGGAERSLYILAHQLRNRGYEITVGCLKGGQLSEKFSEEGFKLFNLDVKRIYTPLGLFRIVKMILLLRKEKISVAITFHKSSDYIGAIFRLLTGTPVVSSRRDMGFDLSPRHVFFYRLLNPLFSSIVTVSNAVKKRIIETQRANEEKIAAIFNGIDRLSFDNINNLSLKNTISNNELISICCLANIRYIKGHKFLVEAIGLIKKNVPNFRLFLVGDYDIESSCYLELMDIIAAQHLQEMVSFVGAIPMAEVPAFLKQMDIAVLPSLSEGMSNALLESMAVGLPIVATSVGGNPEVVEDEKTGYLVPPGDATRLAEALMKLISDSSLRKVMGEEGFAKVNKDFSATRMIDKYEDIIRYVSLRKKLGSQYVKWAMVRWLQRQKQFSKHLISCIFYYGKAVDFFNYLKRKFNRGKVKILCLHDVTYEQDNYGKFSIALNNVFFDNFVEQLSQNYKIVDLKTSCELIFHNNSLNEDYFAITFDDCYKHFAGHVLKQCSKHSIPYAVFLNTDPLDCHRPLLYDALIKLACKTWRKVVVHSCFEGDIFLIDTAESIHHFVENAFARLGKEPISRQRQLVSQLAEYLVGDEQDVHASILTWGEVQRMKEAGVTIGAHTVSHQLLASLSAEDCYNEIYNSKKRLEEELGISIKYFAYPYGYEKSFNAEVINCVQSIGFDYAFTLMGNQKSSNFFAISRKSVNAGLFVNAKGVFSKEMLAMELSGLGDILFWRW